MTEPNPTPAMTAQEALQAIRYVAVQKYVEFSDARYLRHAADDLERALSDAERRATEAEAVTYKVAANANRLNDERNDLQSRLSAVEAAHETTAADYHRLLFLHRETADALSAVEARCGRMREASRGEAMTSARFRLLPVEATEAMLQAGAKAIIDNWYWPPSAPKKRDRKGSMREATPKELASVVLAAAVSAAPVMAEATDWQPIETAPKAANVRVLVGGRTRTGVELTDVATWSATYQRWADAVQGVALGFIPTHWQPITPLPDPPALNASLAIAAGQLGEKEKDK